MGTTCNTEILPNFALLFGDAAEGESQLDYVLLDGFRQPLDEFTMCFWMTSDDRNNYGTPFSYATSTEDNELTITDYNGFVLSVAGEKVVTDVTATDGRWHFICFSWRALDGGWQVLRDGLLADRGEGLATGRRIEAGGLVVLGQEQDERGGGFSAAESFQGQMTRLDMWGHVLTQEEVVGLAANCDPYHGNLLAWPDVHGGLRGQLKVQNLVDWKLVSLFFQVSQLDFCGSCPRLPAPRNANLHIQGRINLNIYKHLPL